MSSGDTNRDSNALRASVLDAALNLGIRNGIVAQWMFDPIEEGAEETGSPGLTSSSTTASEESGISPYEYGFQGPLAPDNRPNKQQAPIVVDSPSNDPLHLFDNSPKPNSGDGIFVDSSSLGSVTPDGKRKKLVKAKPNGEDSDGGYLSDGWRKFKERRARSKSRRRGEGEGDENDGGRVRDESRGRKDRQEGSKSSTSSNVSEPMPLMPTGWRGFQRSDDGHDSDGGYLSESGKKRRAKSNKGSKSSNISETMFEGLSSDVHNLSLTTSTSSVVGSKKTKKKSSKVSADVSYHGDESDGYISEAGAAGSAGKRKKSFFSRAKSSKASKASSQSPPQNTTPLVPPVPAMPPMPLPIAERFTRSTTPTVTTTTESSSLSRSPIPASRSDTPINQGDGSVELSKDLWNNDYIIQPTSNATHSQSDTDSKRGPSPDLSNIGRTSTDTPTPTGNHRSAGSSSSTPRGSTGSEDGHHTLPKTRSRENIVAEQPPPRSQRRQLTLKISTEMISPPNPHIHANKRTPTALNLAPPERSYRALSPALSPDPDYVFVAQGGNSPRLGHSPATLQPPQFGNEPVIMSRRPSAGSVMPSSDYIVPSPGFPPMDVIAEKEALGAARASVLAYYNAGPPPSPPPSIPLPSIPDTPPISRSASPARFMPAAESARRRPSSPRRFLAPPAEGLPRTPTSPSGARRPLSPYARSPTSPSMRSPALPSTRGPSPPIIRPQVSESASNRHAMAFPALFSQPIPTIQRGKQAPFPSQPILPREDMQHLIRHPTITRRQGTYGDQSNDSAAATHLQVGPAPTRSASALGIHGEASRPRDGEVSFEDDDRSVYPDEERGRRSSFMTTYSRGSFLDPDRSAEVRAGFLRSVEASYDRVGNELIEPVPALRPPGQLVRAGKAEKTVRWPEYF
ncbi:hypothetical protein BD410DRAFT_157220 [Rickenella mellea]|uniref:Uncharacterized protein n=1 Tax=Rickenella mellea TaxID=50990 RepID=A0A4Y7Q7U3_9AGAM|nr:hypothetical protein BD410DRAFT_157220 [Rickenella mellea]